MSATCTYCGCPNGCGARIAQRERAMSRFLDPRSWNAKRRKKRSAKGKAA